KPAGAIDGRISEGAGGEPRRTDQGQPRELAIRRVVPSDRDADDDDALSPDGNHRASGRNLYPDRSHPPIAPPDLYRWARVAEAGPSKLPRLFHRQMDRHGWRRQIRPA